MASSIDPCGCIHDADTYRLTALCRQHEPHGNGLPKRWNEVETPQLQEACEKAAEAWAPLIEMWLRNMRKQL